MNQVSNSNNPATVSNYYVRVDRDGDPKLSSCSPPAGYSTVAGAQQAEIKEINEGIRFHIEMIGAFLNDLAQAKKQQRRMRLYCEINGLMNEIEKARSEEAKVRKLRP
jgi:hypothetical protein